LGSGRRRLLIGYKRGYRRGTQGNEPWPAGYCTDWVHRTNEEWLELLDEAETQIQKDRQNIEAVIKQARQDETRNKKRLRLIEENETREAAIP
jgi:hypothetical protein